MQTLDPYHIPLEAINLIEASAGTGKSWTVSLLYLRLILESELTVDQILVVTFTDAATKELRDAIRQRLVEALDYFKYKKSDKEEYQKLYQAARHGTDENAIERLNLAKLSLDEAAVFTIHGFCQRALSENAFEAGLSFESELMDDDKELMQNLTDDFWRRRFQKAPKALLFKLQQKKITPDSLLNDIRFAVGKPYLQVCGPEITHNQEAEWQSLDDAFQQVMEAWEGCKDDLFSLFFDQGREDEYLKGLKDNRDEIFNTLESFSCFKHMPSSLNMTVLSWLGTKGKTYKKFASIEHPFCEQWQCFLDLWKSLESRSDEFLNQIRIDLLGYLQQELPLEKQRKGLMSFDDLLLQLDKALQNQPELAQTIYQKYPVAMIDEFQDTDPTQYHIFSQIYRQPENTLKHSAVFLVGDPKQAIYSFRGGDIHTYIKAKNETAETNRFTLKKNWRSHPKLIDAFNCLYQQAENPFYDNDIRYVEVDAGNRITDDLVIPKLSGEEQGALRFWQYQTAEEKPAIEDIRKEIATAVAGDIATTLNAAKNGNALIGDKPITGGDIAVLVRTHGQGNLIKLALNQKGIASVQSSKNSIFETHEAVEILRLLTAIVEPQREDEVRRALVTELMGGAAEDLITYERDTNAWENQLYLMQNWHYQWKQNGFLPMMRSLMKSTKMHQRLLAFDDGERRLTNALHLAEIIHHKTRQKSLSMEETLRWLKQQQGDNNNSTEKELRLESDENLVKIVTIHKSKGLEYPIVYCPFVGMIDERTVSGVFDFYKDKKACLEVGSENTKEHKALKTIDQQAENLRLLYVALTRAKYQCTVVSFPRVLSASDKSALSRLLTGGKHYLGKKKLSKKETENNESYNSAYYGYLKQLAQTDNISATDMPVFEEGLRYRPQTSEQELTARIFTATIKPQAQITSFSGLTAGVHVETPDHDNASNILGKFESDTLLMPKPEVLDNVFPRGATAGSALHEIYENIDFQTPIAEQQTIVLSALNKWGFDEKHAQAASLLMEGSLNSSLFEDFQLKQLSARQRLNEMEFYLPLERLQIDDLKQILFKYLPADKQAFRDAIEGLYFEQVEGYLKGFIDLIFVHQGKYYLADYKSNSLADYSAESLPSVMADSHYYLQYLLYSVALHRYLQKRVADYKWDSHVGGAYYLFVRGMSAETGNGIFFDKPSLALIEALDRLFVRLTADA